MDVKPRLGLSHWLTLLVIGTTLPLLLFAGAALYKMARDARAAQERGQADIVRALALAVDGEVRAWTAVVTALAESQSLRPDRLAEFYTEARQVAAPYDGWVVLTVASGEQLLNTLRPYGAPLAKTSSPETIAAVFREGKPFVSDVFYGQNAQRYMVAVAVPVVRGDKVVNCLTLNFAPQRLTQVLQGQQVPPTWIAALNDRQGRVVARSQYIEARIGKPTVPWLIEAIQTADHGIATGPLTDGRVGQVAFQRLQEVPWTVNITIPVAELPSARPVQWFALLAVLLGVSGLGVALYISRRITASIGRLAAHATALTKGDAPALGGLLPVRELQGLHQALIEASATAQALHHEQARAAVAEEQAKAAATAAQMSREHAQALQASEARFRELFEHATDAILVTDPIGAGRILAVNPAACRLFGYTEAEFLGLTREATVDLTDAQLAPMLRSRERNGRVSAELTYKRKDGTRFQGELTSAVFDPPGGPQRAVAIVRDITERKRAEATLQATLHRFYHMLASMYCGILLMTDDGRVEFVNQAFCDYYGLTEAPKDLVGLASGDLLTKIKPAYRHPDEAVARIREILERGQPVQGEEFAMQGGRTALRDFVPLSVDGKSYGRLWIHVDITERTQTEHALRESRAKLEAALASMTDAVFISDAEGRFIDFNEAFATFHRFPNKAACAKTLAEYPDILDVFMADGALAPLDMWAVPRALRGETAANAEYTLRRKDTGETWVGSYSFAPIRNAAGEIVGSVVVGRDVTDRKRAEEALQHAKDELERRVQERTAELTHKASQLQALTAELTLAEQRERQRLAQVLHDGLQQLLVAANVRLNLLVRGNPSGVGDGGREVAHLLGEAIAISRTLTGELSPPILQTGGLVAGLEWLVRWKAEKYQLAVELDADPRAVPDSEAMTLLLFQSVRELLFNVVKHAQVRAARVEVRQQDGHLHVVVSDQGVGFDPTTLPAAGSGGLGLASIRQRLEFLGGCVGIASAPGQGCRISLTAPLQSRASAPPAPSGLLEAGHPTRRPGRRATIRVLLVDDHAVVRHALAQMLGAEPDLQVVGEAANGKVAVELTKQLQPDVVLMDLNMPVLNGTDATQQIRADCPGVQVIGLSMFGAAEQAAAMRSAGAVAYVSKTAPAEELLAAIRAAAK